MTTSGIWMNPIPLLPEQVRPNDTEDGPPCVPPSAPRAASPVIRRASAIEQATQLSRDPVIVGALVRDLLLLNEIKDAIGALQAARSAVVSGDHEAMRVELAMASRCLRNATEIE